MSANDETAASPAETREGLAARIEADAIERWGALPLATEVAAAIVRTASPAVSLPGEEKKP